MRGHRTSRVAALTALVVGLMLLGVVAQGQGATPARIPLRQLLAPRSFNLSVSIEGHGAGQVSDQSEAIDCPTSCQARLLTLPVPGSAITLTATPETGNQFVGWGGACSGIAPTCTLAPSQATTGAVTAEFATAATGTPQTVTVVPSENGTVQSTPSGIDCPSSSCSTQAAPGFPLILQATPAFGFKLGHWKGCVASHETPSTCTLPVPVGGATVKAVFVRDFSIEILRNGDGTVSSDPPGSDPSTGAPLADCGSDNPYTAQCISSYPPRTTVTLTAHSAPGSSFSGWSIPTCQHSLTCVIPVTRYRVVSANFSPQEVSVGVFGSGTITSTPPGLTCSGRCSGSFATGTVVTLTATPGTAAVTFKGWDATNCTPLPTDPTSCVLIADVPSYVVARFSDSNIEQQAERLGGVRLTVRKAGAGKGSISSDDGNVDCDSGCRTRTTQQYYNSGDSVALAATAAPGSLFAHWSWQCLGQTRQPVCKVQAGAVTEVAATFRKVK